MAQAALTRRLALPLLDDAHHPDGQDRGWRLQWAAPLSGRGASLCGACVRKRAPRSA